MPMSLFARYGADALADAAEKCTAAMGDVELGAALVDRATALDSGGRATVADAIFAAFRERGESSDDAVEGAGTTLQQIESGDARALESLVLYAQTSPGLLREAITQYEELHPDHVGELPPVLLDGMSARLTQLA
jgi:hypothetical protein